ncbi:N-acetylglucosamine-6-phosphate deacetylase [Paenibacillus koleovorans]|uniref:N-acetylglucosamine-6-phosphate deacetylase n=1 Tax=Paenibacillus koleovorans TaxID=121608 RepID=UPI000FDC7FA7|nr:N-acetylglucosamine-6-phosphate deacetylase [Paenibacillus koleovorans]
MRAEWTGKHWLTGEPTRLVTADGTIVSVREAEHAPYYWIAPGLIDVQLNGIGGFDLNDRSVTVDTVKQIVRVLHKGGVTRFCPTVVTGTRERMLHTIRVIAAACDQDPLIRYTVMGIHVEGPFISPEDGPRGAHNRDWVRDPDWEELEQWLEASGGRVRKVTLAPERPGAIEMIRRLRQLGIIAAIGHTGAQEEDIRQAVKAGASMSTHLGNGAHPYIKRHPNYIWSQLAEDSLWAGLIADGHHLPVATLKAMIRVKGRKAILTSDAVHLAGMPPGRYTSHMNGEVVLEPNGLLHLAQQPDIMAGSATPLHIGLQRVAASGICSLGEAINMASLHPAELFGLAHQGVGQLGAGSPADFIVYDWNEDCSLTVVRTISAGAVVYESEEARLGGRM